MPYLNQIWFGDDEKCTEVQKSLEITKERLKPTNRKNTFGDIIYAWLKAYNKDDPIYLDSNNKTYELTSKEKIDNITATQRQEIKNLLHYIERKKASSDMHARLFEILDYFYENTNLQEFDTRIKLAKELIQINGE